MTLKDKLVFYGLIYPLVAILCVVMMILERDGDDDFQFDDVEGSK